jgi:hypothetical protein
MVTSVPSTAHKEVQESSRGLVNTSSSLSNYVVFTFKAAHSHDVVPAAVRLNVRGEGRVEAREGGVHEDLAAGGSITEEHAVVLWVVVHRQDARVPVVATKKALTQKGLPRWQHPLLWL